MNPTNDRIIVRCNMKQKDFLEIGGVKYMMAPLFEKNYREKSPVLGEIVEGNKFIRKGQVAIFHHAHFYAPSPYFLYDDLYSVPFNRTLFGILDASGDFTPLCGNIICERVQVETAIPLPPEQRKTHIDRAIVVNGSASKYKLGQLIFHTPNAGYDIVCNIDGVQTIITKVHEEFVIGVV